MNLYAYVNNDPINGRDPSGLAQENPAHPAWIDPCGASGGCGPVDVEKVEVTGSRFAAGRDRAAEQQATRDLQREIPVERVVVTGERKKKKDDDPPKPPKARASPPPPAVAGGTQDDDGGSRFRCQQKCQKDCEVKVLDKFAEQFGHHIREAFRAGRLAAVLPASIFLGFQQAVAVCRNECYENNCTG